MTLGGVYAIIQTMDITMTRTKNEMYKINICSGAFAIASQSVSRLLRRDLGKRPPMYKGGHQENDPSIEHCLSSSYHM